jgi:hypothetical protein
MNSIIKTRLAKLEAHYSEPDNRPEAIFVGVVRAEKGKPKYVPVVGWASLGGDHKVWRAPGETDQQLQQRAITEARTRIKPEAIPVFIQLTEEDQQ